MTDTTTEAVARVAELEAELRRWRKAAEKGSIYTRAELEASVAAALEEAINRVNGCDRVSEVQPAIRALISDPSILAKRDAQMKAEGLREAAGLIKPPKFCLPDQVGRVEAMHEMRHATLARADEIEKGEG